MKVAETIKNQMPLMGNVTAPSELNEEFKRLAKPPMTGEIDTHHRLRSHDTPNAESRSSSKHSKEKRAKHESNTNIAVHRGTKTT